MSHKNKYNILKKSVSKKKRIRQIKNTNDKQKDHFKAQKNIQQNGNEKKGWR